MNRILFLLIASILLAACQPKGPIDLGAIEGRARAGEAGAFRELVSLLAVDENEVNARVYEILLSIGQESIPYLIEKVSSEDRVQRERVIAALGTLNARDAVKPIAAVLADTRLGRRYVAAWALGEIGDPSGASSLIAALDDDDAEVRKYATRSLIKLNESALIPLISSLDGASERAAGGMIRAMGDIGDRRALDALLTRVDGPNRLDVFLALGKLKDPRAEAALIKGLADSDWKVRMNAAMALGPLGGEAAVSPLRKTLEDEVHVVREWSARSLEMITGGHITYRNEKGEYVSPYNIYH